MKQLVTLIAALAFLLLPTVCIAQTETIDTDRPDQSDGVATVPRFQLQIEEGATVADETLVNNLMLRFGLTHSTEVRLLADAGKESGISGLQPLTLSLKQKILEQKKVIPAITFVGYVSYEKLSTKGFQGNKIPYEFKLAFENELSDQFSIGYNIGAADEFKTLTAILNFGYAPTDKLATFIEYFADYSNLKPEHNIDAGILYLVKPNFQLDIAAAHSLFASESRFYLTFGVSYLFEKAKK